MSATEVVPCMLTALFAAAAVRALRQAVLTRAPGCRSRIDHLLHAAMALAMAVMPWSWGSALPGLPQSVFFACAALWFPLTAVRSGRERQLSATARRLPYAVGMAAMTWMSYRAAGHSHQTMAEGVPTADPALHLGHSLGQSRAGSVVTGVLALYLLTCALRSLTRDMPALRKTAEASGTSTCLKGACNRFWDGVTALGTVVMLLMAH
ncbi:uncharacterized protein DUF5134 [Streptomyces sp. Ag109_O5-1]|uniref:DUF5134 domain-containing protein n=1 Tax=Streptomyces sp. Ag109_O5-1 TaxID=1938851 RepID=UPI000F4EDE8F|nr:DUF5134 domain-containing protein [Streptomyces sp. Ag109_O5-1]RPE46024.1 uncharacterized protein DUF5134 [Streptomyces sp. Ag109_O5-1]